MSFFDRITTLIPAPTPGFPVVVDRYTARIASSGDDVRAAQKLRFEVFNAELGEGLEESWITGHDEDRFDDVCDHLLVEENITGAIVGTYRLLPGPRALESGLGYYSSQEFDLGCFEPHRARVLELGRACVHFDHRNQTVLSLLWRGISVYARGCGARLLVGCSSLTSQSPAEGAVVYQAMAGKYLSPEIYRVRPMPDYVFQMEHTQKIEVKIPRLLAAYLAVGAKICGEPAIDREFKTIDFLTLLDLDNVPASVIRKYLA